MTVGDPRDARIAELEAENAAQKARIAELERKVGELVEVVLALKEQLNRRSGNSDKPPSSDPPWTRGERRRKNKSERKRGGQPGHSGSSRGLLPPEQVNEFINLFPHECENCWAALPKTPDSSAQRFQTTELLPIQPHTTEYLRHCVVCPCCSYKTWARVDQIPASPFGPRLCSIIALLTGVYHLSRRGAVNLLSDLVGVTISLGAVSTIEGRVSDAVKPPVDEARKKVEQAEVKHTDGTSWYQGGSLQSLWTIATAFATVFKIVASGAKDVLKPLFGEQPYGILVSDRAKALNFWAMARRQICWAHLLRKFISFSERRGKAAPLGRSFSTTWPSCLPTGTT